MDEKIIALLRGRENEFTSGEDIDLVIFNFQFPIFAGGCEDHGFIADPGGGGVKKDFEFSGKHGGLCCQ